MKTRDEKLLSLIDNFNERSIQYYKDGEIGEAENYGEFRNRFLTAINELFEKSDVGEFVPNGEDWFSLCCVCHKPLIKGEAHKVWICKEHIKSIITEKFKKGRAMLKMIGCMILSTIFSGIGVFMIWTATLFMKIAFGIE